MCVRKERERERGNRAENSLREKNVPKDEVKEEEGEGEGGGGRLRLPSSETLICLHFDHFPTNQLGINAVNGISRIFFLTF